MDWPSLLISLKLASVTTALLTLIALPLAYWLFVTRNPLKFIIEAIVALPIVLPPTVLGFYLLHALGPNGSVGKIYTQLTNGARIPFSFFGLIIGSVLYSLPFAVQPILTGFQAVDRRWIEASWCLGASKWTSFLKIIIPLSKNSILTGMLLAFAHTIGEFGVVLMMGGNIPGSTRTISVSIYDDVQSMNYAGASQSALILLVFSTFVLLLVTLLKKKN